MSSLAKKVIKGAKKAIKARPRATRHARCPSSATLPPDLAGEKPQLGHT